MAVTVAVGSIDSAKRESIHILDAVNCPINCSGVFHLTRYLCKRRFFTVKGTIAQQSLAGSDGDWARDTHHQSPGRFCCLIGGLEFAREQCTQQNFKLTFGSFGSHRKCASQHLDRAEAS